MKRPAKKIKLSNGILGAVGAAVVGLAAGAAAMFLSKEENRQNVKKTVDATVKKGKAEISKAKKKIIATKKKLIRK